jgi:hypothetical protein
MAVRLDRDRKAALGKLNPEFFQCRDLHHDDKELTWTAINSPIRGYEQVIRCDTCKRERVRLFNRNYVFQYGYTRRYERGYLLEGIGRMTAEDKAYLRSLARA